MPVAATTDGSGVSKIDSWVAAGFLLAGALAFLGGGRLHPRIGGDLGPVGSDAFFRGFAHEILNRPGWEAMHALILAGPVLWALGCGGIVRLLPRGAAALAEIGRAALLLAAPAWTLAFILDGFVAPRYARLLTEASGSPEERFLILGFGTNQATMALLGGVSVVLMGIATAALAAALLPTARLISWRGVVGVAGLLTGGWILIAAAQGELFPGPFTSEYWMATALAIGLWYGALGSVVWLQGDGEIINAR